MMFTDEMREMFLTGGQIAILCLSPAIVWALVASIVNRSIG